MATTITIIIEDRTAGQAWLKEVEAINEDYKRAMEAAAKCLEDMKGDAEGDIIDTIADLGNSLLNAAEQTFEAISAIAETVTKICDIVEDVKETIKDGVLGVVGKLFG